MGFREVRKKGSIKVRELPDMSKPISLYFGGTGMLTPTYRYYTKNDIVVPPLDFGEALYLAESIDDAKFWAYHSCLNSTSRVATVTCFNFNPEGLRGYTLAEDYTDENLVLNYIANLLKFSAHSEVTSLDYDKEAFYREYAGFDVNDYDYVIAPRLDSCYSRIIWEFENNNITVGEFSEALKHNIYDGYQICLISEKAHDALSRSYTTGCPKSVLLEAKEDRYYKLKDMVKEVLKSSGKTRYNGVFAKTIKEFEVK